MLVQVLKCDGCGEKIEAVAEDNLSNVTAGRNKQIAEAGALYFEVTTIAMAWLDTSQGKNREERRRGSFQICTKCAETRTISSFHLALPLT